MTISHLMSDPSRCRVVNDTIAVHWYPKGTVPGGRCLCGELTMREGDDTDTSDHLHDCEEADCEDYDAQAGTCCSHCPGWALAPGAGGKGGAA